MQGLAQPYTWRSSQLRSLVLPTPAVQLSMKMKMRWTGARCRGDGQDGNEDYLQAHVVEAGTRLYDQLMLINPLFFCFRKD
jgi:hypothetical protein